jgi:ATP-binding protein involved in chromosome partitioning
MSYFIAPDTGHRYDNFGHGGGARMAQEVGVDFLGEVPLEPQVRIGGDEGSPIVVGAPESAAAQAIRTLAHKVAAAISVQNLLHAPRQFQADPTLSILN